MDRTATRAPFSPQLRRVLVVTTLGSFLALLDATIVNVALESLAHRMDSPLATIQWVVTAYLLALAAVLPISHWTATRYGAKRVYVVSLAAFALASLACGLATSVGQLIGFRVIQGAAAALATPVAQMISVRTAGPQLLPRVMSVTGVPTILAPILGPTAGGLLLEHVGWRWIFLINVPIAALGVLLALRLLPNDERAPAGRLDLTGLLALALGSVGLTYGLAEFGERGRLTSPAVLGWVAAGLVFLTFFVGHALRAARPLLDLRLYRSPVYAAASLTNFCIGAVIFGATILMPLYFQVVRHEDAVATGLLLIPQGIGVAIAFVFAARLTDSLGSGRTALFGGLVSIVATVPFVLIQADTPYWLLGAAMVGRGFGIGACIPPTIAAAYRSVPPAAIGDATVQLNVLQRIGGSLSTALFAVVLQGRLDSATTPAALAAGFGVTFWWVLAIAVCATAPTLLLTRVERRAATATRAAAPAKPAPSPEPAPRGSVD